MLTALSTILPAGTTVATTVIEKGLDTATAPLPGLILNAPPPAHRLRVGVGRTGPYQWTHTIHALLVDVWQAGTQTEEEKIAAVRAQLLLMATNVSQNPQLIVADTINAYAAADDMTMNVNRPVSDEGLGFPVIAGELVLVVKDIYDYFTVS